MTYREASGGGDGPRVAWVYRSRNRKTGPIPVSITHESTCPPSCPWRGGGCYGHHGYTRLHWEALGVEGAGLSYEEFLRVVRGLPGGALWRHNEAGDLPGVGDEVDRVLLGALGESSAHTRGFTYTHKPVLGDGQVAESNREALRSCSGSGLVVNLSADGLGEVDDLADLGIGPVVVVVPRHARGVVTPRGRRVVTCPVVASDRVTCQTCGLCAVSSRDFVVAFPAHGPGTLRVREELLQLRLF